MKGQVRYIVKPRQYIHHLEQSKEFENFCDHKEK